MTYKSDNGLGPFVLAGIGAGALTGALLGFLATRRSRSGAVDEIRDSVGDLKRRAEQILSDLSRAGLEAPSPTDR